MKHLFSSICLFWLGTLGLTSAAFAEDTEEWNNDTEEFSMDTPDEEDGMDNYDTDDEPIIAVLDSAVIDSVAASQTGRRRPKIDRFWGVRMDAAANLADVSSDIPYAGGYLLLGVARKWHFNKAIDFDVTSGLGLGVSMMKTIDNNVDEVLDGEVDPREVLDEETISRVIVSVPGTIQKDFKLFRYFSFLVDFGLQADVVVYGERCRKTLFDEETEEFYFDGTLYAITGLGSSYKLFGYTLEYVLRSSYYLAGFRAGEHFEFREGLSVSLWF